MGCGRSVLRACTTGAATGRGLRNVRAGSCAEHASVGPGGRPDGVSAAFRKHADWLAEVSVVAGDRLVLNARVDTFLHGESAPEHTIARGLLYAGAGADVIYPILAPAGLLSELAEAIGTPLNALYRPGGPEPAELGELGAARVTFGGGLRDRAVAAVQDLARRPTAGG